MTIVVALRPDVAQEAVPEIPRGLSFREMAEELLLAAKREASSLDALHLFTLRDPTSVGVATIAEVQRQCANFLDYSNLLRALAPHEEFIRQIAAREVRP